MYFFLPSEIILLAQISKIYKNKLTAFLIDLYLIIIAFLTFYLLYIYWDTDTIYPYIIRNMSIGIGGN